MPTSPVAADLLTLAEALLALALGGAVGWERERKRKGAGFRTMMLVSLSSFLFVEVSLVAGLHAPGAGDAVQSDPVRAIQAIATGLGFLGAGIVFRDREADRTRGLTTAASLLVVSPIGIAVALGHYVLAVGATVLLVLVLTVAERVEGLPDEA
jgi:putative Mg2+ transporter-C (MgtC) family protein